MNQWCLALASQEPSISLVNGRFSLSNLKLSSAQYYDRLTCEGVSTPTPLLLCYSIQINFGLLSLANCTELHLMQHSLLDFKFLFTGASHALAHPHCTRFILLDFVVKPIAIGFRVPKHDGARDGRHLLSEAWLIEQGASRTR